MEKSIRLKFQALFISTGTWLCWFLGGWDGLLYSLVAFVAVDYISGILSAVLHCKLSSKVGIKGIFKKVYIFILVGMAHVIDAYIIGEGGLIRAATILFFISNEGISILENASQAGIPVPMKLKNILEQYQAKAAEKKGQAM